MRRHRRTRKEIKKRNITIVMVIVFLISVFSVGYGAFQANLNISIIGKIKRTDFYVSNTGNDTTGDGTLNNPYLTIQKAYNEAYSKANIYIMNDISLSTTINMNSNKKITLTSYSTNNIVHSVIKTAAINGYSINLTSGTLTLKDITLDGNNIEDTNGGIYFENSNLNIDKGMTIKRFVSTSNGGGIASGNNSLLTMTGGEISNNRLITNENANGGGIYLGANSSLNISGGIISNNEADRYGGGIYAIGSGTVIISETDPINNPTLISNNRTTRTSSGNGGGLYIGGCKVFNMTGGTISNNYCDGCGGGLYLDGSVEHTISGGKITENEASNNSGGILLAYNNTKLTMSGGEISSNEASWVGGMYVYDGSIFEMNGGIIKNNISTSTNGGIVKKEGSTITINSGIICGNTPSNSYDNPTTCHS